MKILIACEFSGIIRSAFEKKGHDAISCDLRPTETPGKHYCGNVFDIIDSGFDMMIAHPPCKYLSYAGTRHWNKPGRISKRLKALDFFRKLWEAPIPRICIENPRGIASPTIAKYSQAIEPYYFGDPELKTTWLWLKNLPELIHTPQPTLFEPKTHTHRPQPKTIDSTGKRRYFTDSKLRQAKDRARSFSGIAAEMANQWNY